MCDDPCKIQFHLNDIDHNLIDFLVNYREKGIDHFFDYTRERLNECGFTENQSKIVDGESQISPEEYFYSKKVKHGLFDPKSESVPRRWPKLRKSPKLISGERFFRGADITFTNVDWLETANQYVDDSTACIFLDPPYCNSWNKGYAVVTSRFTDDGFIADPTTIYVNILKLMRRSKAQVIFSINALSILHELFSEFDCQVYDHRYLHPRKSQNGTFNGQSVKHMLITNKK